MGRSRRLQCSCTKTQRWALLLLSFGLVVSVSSSSNNQPQKAQFSSLLLTPRPDSIRVSWTPDDRVNGTGINYTVAWSTDGRRRGELFVREREERVRKITGLKPCTTYDISVTASDGSRTTMENSTTTHVKEPLKAVGLAANNITAHSLALSWERPATACEITAYNITYYGVAKWGPEHTGSSTIGRGEANSTTTIVIVGLQPYTEYTVTMAAYTAAGEGEVTNITTTTLEGVPSKPTDVRTNSEVSNTIIVTWGKPKQIPGVLGRYSISWHRNNQTVGQDVITSPMYAITSLSPCVEYTVRVAATTGAEEGNYKEITQMTGKAPTVPAPANCSYNSKNKSLSLTWTKPESNCNISSYKVLWTHANGTNVTSTDEDLFFTTNTSVATGRICMAAVVGKEEGQWRCCDYSDPSSNINDDAGTDKSSWMISVAISFVASVALIATVAGIMQLIRRKKTKTRRRNSIRCSGNVYYDKLLEKLESHMQILHQSSNLQKEFEELTIASYESMKERSPNRKKKDMKFGKKGSPDADERSLCSDTIYATIVKGTDSEEITFIACQGPEEGHETEFWSLVWEQDVKTIVMLDACSSYWPTNLVDSVDHGIFTLAIGKLIKRSSFEQREIIVTKEREEKLVMQFQMGHDLMFKAKKSEKDLLELIRSVRQMAEPGHNQVLVHCSPGVGKTGTFIGLYELQLATEKKLPTVEVKEVVLAMRRCRKMLVQDKEQYLFLHSCFAVFLQEMITYSQLTAAAPAAAVAAAAVAAAASAAAPPKSKRRWWCRAGGLSSTTSKAKALQRPSRKIPPVPSSTETIAMATTSGDDRDDDHSYYYPKITDKVKKEIRRREKSPLVIVHTAVAEV